MTITVPEASTDRVAAIRDLHDRLDTRLSLAGWEGEESFEGCYAWRRVAAGSFPRRHFTISFDDCGNLLAFGPHDETLLVAAHAEDLGLDGVLDALRDAGVALGAAS